MIPGTCSSKSSVSEKYIASINIKKLDFIFIEITSFLTNQRRELLFVIVRALPAVSPFLRHCRINEMRCLVHTNYQGHFIHQNKTMKTSLYKQMISLVIKQEIIWTSLSQNKDWFRLCRGRVLNKVNVWNLIFTF